jgi:uncharacterized surface protein with fasciclin (FAS1) repeats
MFGQPSIVLQETTMNANIKLRTAGVMLALAAAGAASAADLADTAARSLNLRIFSAALKTEGFTQALRSTGPYTMFAPSDEAFNRLSPGGLDALTKDKVRLAALLAHHVISGKMLITEIKPGRVETIQGDFITLKSDNGKVTVDHANVVESDLNADNGVIHIIDSVLIAQ